MPPRKKPVTLDGFTESQMRYYNAIVRENPNAQITPRQLRAIQTAYEKNVDIDGDVRPLYKIPKKRETKGKRGVQETSKVAREVQTEMPALPTTEEEWLRYRDKKDAKDIKRFDELQALSRERERLVPEARNTSDAKKKRLLNARIAVLEERQESLRKKLNILPSI